MKLRFFSAGWLLFLCLSFGLPRYSVASHAKAFDFNFKCLGNNRYIISGIFYRDCSGISGPSSINLSIEAPSNLYGPFCSPEFIVTLPLVSFQEISQICPSEIQQTYCNPGGGYSLPGVEQYLYSDTVVFPAACPNWIVTFSHCCRSGMIIPGGGSQNFIAQALINNSTGICNNSPVFHSPPTLFICPNTPFNYNMGAVDPDRDSLVYQLVQPQNFIGSLNLDPVTGQLTLNTNTIQVAEITIRVNEYRNGVLLGFINRELNIVVYVCNNFQPQISGILNYTGGPGLQLIDSNTIEVCPDYPVQFSLLAYDPDASDTITVTSNIGQATPGAVLNQQVISSNQVLLNFNWTPTALETGLNMFVVRVSDNVCPVYAMQFYAFAIWVKPGTYAGTDLTYCPAGGPVQLNAVGGNTFTWSPTTGLSNPNIANPLASPSVTTTYVVTSNLTNACNFTDTVTVFVVPDFNILSFSGDDTICKYGATQLSIVPDPAQGPYTYNWSPSNSLINPNSNSPFANPLTTTTYSVSVTSATGCTQTDSLTVYVIGEAPLVTVSSSHQGICPSGPFQLEGQFSSVVCGANPAGCGAGNPAVMTQVGSSTISVPTPFQGIYTDGRSQMMFHASELTGAGIGAGTITRLSFEVIQKNSVNPYQNFTIKIGCTGNSSLNNLAWISGLTQVYSVPAIVTLLGWNTFHFQTGYDWDGLTNLVVEICWDNSTASPDGNDMVNGISTSFPSSTRNYLNNANGCNINPAFVYSERPNIRFWHCSPNLSQYTFSWSPAAGLSNPHILNPTANIFQGQTYFLSVSDSVCEGIGFVNIAIDSNYYIAATNDTIVCPGDTIQLNVSVFGDPPLTAVNCGVYQTACSSPNQVVQLGTQTLTMNQGSPYYGFYEDARAQYLILASELTAAGLTAGTITALSFKVITKQSSQPYNGFTIGMRCVTNPSLPLPPDPTGLHRVLGPGSYNPVVGWNTHQFSTPFNWDGVSDIVVEVCFDNSSWTQTDLVEAHSSFVNSTYFGYADGQIGCQLTNLNSMNTRPNMQFTFCPAPPGQITYNWSPGNLLSDSTIASPLFHATADATFTVAVTMANGCVLVDTVHVSLYEPEIQVISPPNC